MLSDLGDFDDYIKAQVHEWNAPGIGVSIVKDEKVIFTRGYGYRDYANRLPFLSSTLFPIASNTKLFTAIAAGILVEKGALTFDQPIRDVVPSLRFYDKSLDAAVTLRDMLGHRTGVPRYDMILHRAEFSKKELFDRIRFMKPIAPFRSKLIYNNMMYEAVGHIIELLSGKSWDQFVRDEVLSPVGMPQTAFTIAGMLAHPNHAVPFTERRDSEALWQTPYPELNWSSPAGSIVSSLDDMSRWLAVLMNNGVMAGKKVIPEQILQATLAPGLAFPDPLGDVLGFEPEINSIYGMGRQTSSYRGHLLASHGGDLRAFHSQVSYLPREKLGVVVFVIGDHCSMLRNAVGYNVYDRLLGLGESSSMDALREFHLKAKQNMRESRERVRPSAIPDTRFSHDLADYVGRYEHPAYGQLHISLNDFQLQFRFRQTKLPLHHYHYDRFDTDDDEAEGAWSMSFLTSPLGDIDRVSLWLDATDAVFVRIPDAPAPGVLKQLTGTYQAAFGAKCAIKLRRDNQLMLHFPEAPAEVLTPLKGLQFRNPKWPQRTFEFVMENGRVVALRHWNSVAEFVLTRVENADSADTMEHEEPIAD
ncbi:CubicO group peptidase (beta-lactamase class C family) [Paraburkholderia sp. CI2]|uniref:serine hydrolase n=1 Tax=Paraburkholderia sp. CI2 TaxID=2723093 RepID=UPI0016104C5B|nr:serine hydrolase [Paraburkholderia sp. CI2]MBB5469842.1 CubicO group peptidase (beta-lactamase class C family) [Paraburkholderia sp. CI2]